MTLVTMARFLAQLQQKFTLQHLEWRTLMEMCSSEDLFQFTLKEMARPYAVN